MASPTLQELIDQIKAQNVSQFGPIDSTVNSYKEAAEYAAEAKDWADLCEQIYLSLKDANLEDIIQAVTDARNAAAAAATSASEAAATELRIQESVTTIDGWITDMSVTPFPYTGVGGETTIVLPEGFREVQVIYLNGGRQERGDDFLYDLNTRTITLMNPLFLDDRVTVLSSTIYEQTSTLAQILSGVSGADYIKTGDGDSVQKKLNSVKPIFLSTYGLNRDGLVSFINYAKNSGSECVIDGDVVLTEPINIDLNGGVLRLRFEGSIMSDSQLLTLTNLGNGSYLKNPDFKNITTPTVIVRWDSDGNWVFPTTATTDSEVGYQPTGSDSDVWNTLPESVKNQQICSGIIINKSTGIDVFSMTGRYSAITFKDCNHCRVINPNFMGGKHQYGSILFNNTGSSSWGEGNCVIGGTVRYGSVSGVVFMRNKGYSGGVFGGFVPYRVGESGVKTYQNNVNGISARNYQLTIDSVFAFQCYYDGVDVFSDYGTQVERVGDFTLSQYSWGQLPTQHRVNNISAKDCHSTGVTGDGQFNTYSNIEITESFSSGFFNSGSNNVVKGIIVKNGNKNNNALGAQIRMLGISSVSDVTIITDPSKVSSGSSLYTTGASTSLSNINLDGTTLSATPLHPAKQNLYLGRISSTDNFCSIEANPRPTILPNPSGRINFNLTLGSVGSEQGEVDIQGVYGGSFVKGVRARGDASGFMIGGLATSFNSALLRNGEFCLYENSGTIHIAAKLSTGVVVDKTL